MGLSGTTNGHHASLFWKDRDPTHMPHSFTVGLKETPIFQLVTPQDDSMQITFMTHLLQYICDMINYEIDIQRTKERSSLPS